MSIPLFIAGLVAGYIIARYPDAVAKTLRSLLDKARAAIQRIREKQ